MDKTHRKAIIAGNWKMNNTQSSTAQLIEALKPLVKDAGCEVVACVPFTALHTALFGAAGSNIKIGAQNCHWANAGAFTGEISAEMLTDVGAAYVLVGHSERRQYFGETDTTVNQRLHAALDAGLTAILCVGETQEQRQQGITCEMLGLQVKTALGNIRKSQLSRISIAYEPIWAIGTGKTATANDANAACGHIRNVVSSLYGDDAARALIIQYGGSMSAGNAAELLAQPHIDGGLIGGAALSAEDFASIVQAASRMPATT